MDHTHEFESVNYFTKLATCECGKERAATVEELAYERELIEESEQKSMLQFAMQDLRDASDALAEM